MYGKLPLREPRILIVGFIAPPGAGKTYIVRKVSQKIIGGDELAISVISSDDIRARLFDREQQYNEEMGRIIFKEQIKEASNFSLGLIRDCIDGENCRGIAFIDKTGINWYEVFFPLVGIFGGLIYGIWLNNTIPLEGKCGRIKKSIERAYEPFIEVYGESEERAKESLEIALDIIEKNVEKIFGCSENNADKKEVYTINPIVRIEFFSLIPEPTEEVLKGRDLRTFLDNIGYITLLRERCERREYQVYPQDTDWGEVIKRRLLPTYNPHEFFPKLIRSTRERCGGMFTWNVNRTPMSPSISGEIEESYLNEISDRTRKKIEEIIVRFFPSLEYKFK